MQIDIIDLKNNLLSFHSKLRRNPQSVIPSFEDRQSYYKQNLYFVKNKPKKAIRTKQGFAPVRQLIQQLKRTPSFADLTYSQELQKAAQDHANILSRQTQTTLQSNDLQKRVEKYTDWEGHLFQNVQYGFVQPEDLLTNLLIDDGLKNRPNRMNILNPDIRYYGVGLAKHEKYNVVAVFIYATHLRDKRRQAQYVAPRQTMTREERPVYDSDNSRIIKDRQVARVESVSRNQPVQIIQEGENSERVWCGQRENGSTCLLF